MDFATWLQEEMGRRGLNYSELSRLATGAGYPISDSMLSRISLGTREAGPDACIAIAAGLGIPREEVFRARGWLLREPELIVHPDTDDPELVELVREVKELSPRVRKQVLSSWRAAMGVVKVTRTALTQEQTEQALLEDMMHLLENSPDVREEYERVRRARLDAGTGERGRATPAPDETKHAAS